MQQEPLLLSEQVPPADYQTPTVHQVIGGKMADIKGPAQVRLLAEGGYGLDIPLTQDAIDEFYRLLRSLTRTP